MSSWLNIKIPRLGRNRHGTFYVRFSAVDPAGRRRVVQHSLSTKNPRTAKLLALKFCLLLAEEKAVSDFDHSFTRYEVDVPAGKAKANGPEDHKRLLEAIGQFKEVLRLQAALQAQGQALPSTQPLSGPLLPLASLSVAPRGAAPGVKLRAAFDLHLDEEAKRLKSPHTLGEKKVLFNEFIEVFGDVEVNQITALEITLRWRKAEFTRANKKRKGATLSQARLEKRRGYLSKFFDEARTGGLYLGENPVKQKMGTKKEIKANTRSWAEFSVDDLQKLFTPEYPVRMVKPDWYWLPLIALFSAARLGEIANLELSTFQVVEGVALFEFDGKTGRRIVPIHSRLLDLGLWQYVDFLKARTETQLVANRTAAYRQKSVGRIWGNYVRECGIVDTRKVFHSFRSTGITDMHNAEAGHASIRKTVGHAAVGVSGAHGGYVRGIQLMNLKQTIETLRHPGLDVASLKVADPTFAAYFAAEDALANSEKRKAQTESRKRNQAARAARLAQGSRPRANEAKT
jgi:integrase